MKNADWINRYAAELVGSAETRLAKFKANLETNPVYAFEWSGDAFTAAAELQVGTQLHGFCENGDPESDQFVTHCAEFALELAMRAARNPARSTSPTSNLMEQAVASAWATFYEKLNGKF